MLGPDEAEHHPNANVITRAVGVAQDLQVDVSSGDASPGDIFLVASDGLTRLVNDDEMLEILERFEPTEAADKLLEMVLVRGAPDNVSMVIVKMK
jgi:serine/threonine protein phosphatase PrpC